MTPKQTAQTLLQGKTFNACESATCFAPSNIALIKYWGKRDTSLNLPMNSSLSLTLNGQGTTTTLSEIQGEADIVVANGTEQAADSSFARRVTAFLDLFRPTPETHYKVVTENNIPTAAGLASSASGFAALTLALDKLYNWQLPKKDLSIMARLGSGSACRSFWPGFVLWQKGERDDGMDSHGVPLNIEWPELKLTIVEIESKKKATPSREAMQRTVETSTLYKKQWVKQCEQDLNTLQTALDEKDFKLLGITAENNALLMHATMEDANPPVVYSTDKTIEWRNKIWQKRTNGDLIFFTQDAGPNLKTLSLTP